MNVYSIPPLIISVFTIAVGLLVLIRGKRLIYALTTFSVFIWLLGYAIMYSTQDYEKALFFAKILYIAVVFIPAFSYHFTITFLNLKTQKRIIQFNYLVSFIFALVPVSIAIINWVRKTETITKQMLAGILVSVLGVFTLILGSGQSLDFSGSNMKGIIYVFMAQLAFALFTTLSGDLSKKYSRPISPTATILRDF